MIDINYYPTPKTKVSNLLHRPIGIGIQGLADTFALLDIPFCSDEAKTVNKNIFETIYHASLEASNEIAIERYKDITNPAFANMTANSHVFNSKKDKLDVNHLCYQNGKIVNPLIPPPPWWRSK